MNKDLQQAVICLIEGKIIAYPTEAVYGLGCDPFNEAAVTRLLALKKRDVSKGLILIASNWDQINPLIQPLTPNQTQEIHKVWPEPTTWVIPASNFTPKWITGDHDSLAVRITRHPIACALCQAFKNPIVSTSANLSGHLPAKTFQEVANYFDECIDFIMKGDVGNLDNPTPIRDIVTKKHLRTS